MKVPCLLFFFLFSLLFFFPFPLFFFVLFSFFSYRIDAIFNTRSLQMIQMPDSALLKNLAIYGAVDLLLVILWATIDVPGSKLAEADGVERAFVAECSSKNATVFRVLLYLVRGLALLCCAARFNAIRIRGVSEF